MRLFVLIFLLLWQTTAVAGDDPAGKVVAVVGDEKITQREVDDFGRNIPKPFRDAFAAKALERLIDTKVFSNAAIKEGLDRSPGFIARLEKERQRILADYFIEKRLKKRVKVSPSEVEAYYKKYKDRFQQKERVRPAHILVKTKQEAEALKVRLAKGESFEKIARGNIGNPSAKDGGDLGWLERGRMPKAFEDAAFALKKGEISGIVKTRMGFHIIKILDRTKGGVKSLEEARSLIEKRLEANKMASLKKRYREKARVRILDERYQKALTPGSRSLPVRK